MDDATGDGTTSTVLIIGELLKQAENLISEVSTTLNAQIIWSMKIIYLI